MDILFILNVLLLCCVFIMLFNLVRTNLKEKRQQQLELEESTNEKKIRQEEFSSPSKGKIIELKKKVSR